MSRKLFAALLLILLSALPVLHAQDNLTCPAPADIVASVAEACANLEADQVCLARAGVTADTGTDSAFAQPGDRVTAGALAQLVTTAPTADSADFGAVLLNLRANLSRDTVRALVLGGAQIANTNDARLVLPASFRDVGRVRSSPSTTNDDNIMTTLQGGASVTAVARNDAGDWVQISFGDGELGWAATFLLYVEGDAPAQFCAAEKVQAVDSTGAGDAFVGSLSYALAAGRSLGEAVRVGCAVATRSVLKTGTQTSFPYRKEVGDILG